jgi:hypothetical protein
MCGRNIKRSICQLRLDRSKILSGAVVLKNGPDGDYLGTHFRPGDCAASPHNFLKCLKNRWWRRRESNPLPSLYTWRSQAPGKKTGNLGGPNSQDNILRGYSISRHIHRTSLYLLDI